MKLHTETVSPLLLDTLKTLSKSEVFKDFTLVGGTCLSLQLGHRRSIDIDLFTDMEYGKMDTQAMKDFLCKHFPYTENLDSMDQPALGYSVRIGTSPSDKIKVDFFYTEKFIFPIIETEGIRFADIKEIAAMKMKAITEAEPRQKDFWDIYELNNLFTFEEMINWAIRRDEWGVTEADIERGFRHIFNIEESNEGIDDYRGYEWELISIDLKAVADNYFARKLPLSDKKEGAFE